MVEDRGTEVFPLADVDQHLRQRVGRIEHLVVLVRQADMEPHDPSQIRMAGSERRDEGGHGHEPPDMHVPHTAVDRLAIGGQVREEVAVVFLDVRVAVLAGREHEGDVAVEPALWIVVAIPANHFEEFDGQLLVERVFPRGEELVVVNATLAPVCSLFAEDVGLRAGGGVARSPEDAVGMGILRSEIVGDRAVIAGQRLTVVVPVHRHRHGIGDQRTEKCLPRRVDRLVCVGHRLVSLWLHTHPCGRTMEESSRRSCAPAARRSGR